MRTGYLSLRGITNVGHSKGLPLKHWDKVQRANYRGFVSKGCGLRVTTRSLTRLRNISNSS